MSTERGDLARFIGRAFDGLSLEDRWKLSGCWIATELYSPQRLPLRVMEAVGSNPQDCIRQLRSRGLDPTRFEYQALPQPYPPV